MTFYYRDDDHHVKISGDLSFFSGIITSTSAFHNFREKDSKVADDYIKDFEDELVDLSFFRCFCG